MLGNSILATMATALVAVLPVRASFDLKSPQPFGAVDPSRAQEWPCGGQDLEDYVTKPHSMKHSPDQTET